MDLSFPTLATARWRRCPTGQGVPQRQGSGQWGACWLPQSQVCTLTLEHPISPDPKQGKHNLPRQPSRFSAQPPPFEGLPSSMIRSPLRDLSPVSEQKPSHNSKPSPPPQQTGCYVPLLDLLARLSHGAGVPHILRQIGSASPIHTQTHTHRVLPTTSPGRTTPLVPGEKLRQQAARPTTEASPPSSPPPQPLPLHLPPALPW